MENSLHTFVICAYRESAYLEECVKSLLAQTISSRILIATSTPNDLIDRIAETYSIPVHVNHGEAGITGDWNFAMSLVQTTYATIAHQDDVYEPRFAETVLEKMQKAKKPILAFTEYFEVRNGERVFKNNLLRIKKIMNVGFRISANSRWMRRRVLSIGNSICCPSVTYCMEQYNGFRFDGAYRFACDWDAWERLANQKGAFLYIPERLMGHRIHADSETTKLTADTRRAEEEYMMFCRFWPTWIARRLSGFYAKGADSNQL